MAEIERVRYGMDAISGMLFGTPKDAKLWTVTRSCKIAGHWGPAEPIGDAVTYDQAVRAMDELIAENYRKEHPAG
jgi:hypothetical protein